MKRRFVLLSIALIPIAGWSQAANPLVTSSNVHQTICSPGWVQTIRPSKHYTEAIKRRLVIWIGGRPREYELRHIIPMDVGGAPADTRNLTLHPVDASEELHAKDALEQRVQRLICSGQLSLTAGQQCFANGWQSCALRTPSVPR